jgi:hypothetical protein
MLDTIGRDSREMDWIVRVLEREGLKIFVLA